jgi:hypothetical protein
MMEATDFGNRDDPADLWPLDWPAVGCVSVQRQVSSRAVIVRELAGQDAVQMAFAKNEDMIQTLAPDRADEPLRKLGSAMGCEARSALPGSPCPSLGG